MEDRSEWLSACVNRGNAYWKNGDLDRPIADCTEAIRLKPDLADAYNNRGLAYAEKREFDKAIADGTEAGFDLCGFAPALEPIAPELAALVGDDVL